MDRRVLRMTRSRYNAAVDLLDRNAVAGRVGRPYLKTERRDWSYGDVIAASHAAACGFLDLGARHGDRVALAMHDRPELVVGFWGAMRAGLVPLLVPPGLAATELHAILDEADVRFVISDRANAAVLEPLLAVAHGGVTALAVDPPPAGSAFRSWREVCENPGTAPDPTTGEGDPAFLICSSGTTGAPKLVTHLHGSLRLSPEGLGKQVVSLDPSDVVLSVSKMTFSYGLGNSVYTPAAVGASVVLVEPPAIPAIVQARLAAARVTVLYGVPGFYQALAADAQSALPSSVRMALSAGESLDPSLAAAVERRFDCEVLDGFGTTETLQHVTCNRAGAVLRGSCGRVLDGFEIDVRDPHGDPVAEGRSGELWIAGRTLFAGYWGREDLTRRVRSGRWLRTGDRVRLRNGQVFHEGRLDDLMKLGGRWVSPLEVERTLRRHPDLREVAVVSRTNGSGAVWLCAFVVTARADDNLYDELSALCSARLSAYKVPREWVRSDGLPRTRTGKVRRLTLREQLASTRG